MKGPELDWKVLHRVCLALRCRLQGGWCDLGVKEGAKEMCSKGTAGGTEGNEQGWNSENQDGSQGREFLKLELGEGNA